MTDIDKVEIIHRERPKNVWADLLPLISFGVFVLSLFAFFMFGYCQNSAWCTREFFGG